MKTSAAHREMDQKLLSAALRYCAVAAWFESHPCQWHKQMRVDQAMEIFNWAEADLRAAGTKALRQHGHPELILQKAGIPQEPR